MAVKNYKPTSAGRRAMSVSNFSELSRKGPERSLVEGRLNKSGGRNGKGNVTSWHRGGGHKRRYRRIDFRRNKPDVPATVAAVEYDPNRSANIALLHYHDGEKRYILAPLGLAVGDRVRSGAGSEIRPGNALPLSDIPLGTVVHAIELQPWQRRADRESCRGWRSAHGPGGPLRDPASSQRRASACARALSCDGGAARKPGSRESEHRQGGEVSLERASTQRPRRGDEPRRSSDGRRRGAIFGRPAPLYTLGQSPPRATRPAGTGTRTSTS